MRIFSNDYRVSYILETKNNEKFNYSNKACFSDLRDRGYLEKYKDGFVLFKDYKCKKTSEYSDFFLNYIGKMLKLEYEITDDYFKVKLLNNTTSNLIIASLVRMLWEGHDVNSNLEFFKNLKNGKCKYKDLLKRFCHFYRCIDSYYISTSHYIANPRLINIRSTKEFLKMNDYFESNHSRVNSFFHINQLNKIINNK